MTQGTIHVRVSRIGDGAGPVEGEPEAAALNRHIDELPHVDLAVKGDVRLGAIVKEAAGLHGLRPTSNLATLSSAALRRRSTAPSSLQR